MFTKLIVSLVYLIGFQMAFASAFYEMPEKLSEAFVSNFNLGNAEGMKECSYLGFWEGKHDNPQKLIKQGFLKKRVWVFALSKLDRTNNRAVAEVLVLSAETKRPLDAIYLYAENKNKFWLFYGLNEDKKFKRQFLDGQIDGQFYPPELPSFKPLEELGQAIKTKMNQITDSTTAEEVSKIYESSFTLSEKMTKDFHAYLLTSIKTPSEIETHWSEPLQRGVLLISDKKTADNAYPDTVCLYFFKNKSGWELYGIGTMVVSSSFLDF